MTCSARSTATRVRLAAASCMLALYGCAQGEASGNLVGKYAVHGVLVENSCGQGLPTANPLDFQLEIRESDGVAYWSPSKSSRNSGSLSAAGVFRFSTSQTTVIKPSMQVLAEPSDFVSNDPDRDLKQTRACAVTTKETIAGTIQRWRKADGAITESAARADAGSSDDLTADHLIEVAASAGSDCNAALVAFGGKYNALPCEARYQLRGTLDTTGTTGSVRAGANAPKAGAGGKPESSGTGGGS